MGSSRWSASSWSTRSASYVGKTADKLYTSKTIDPTFATKNIKVRESVDSPLNPESTPVILALDTTGSMTSVLEVAIKKFGVIIEQIIDRKPITDPHLLTMFFDDIVFIQDGGLQASQFEADDKAVDQLEKLHITGYGGGNSSESYHLPLYFAAMKTKTDCFDKRKKKGYLFIVGDEECPGPLTQDQIRNAFGNDEPVSDDLSYDDLYTMASRKYHVFHVVVMQGSHANDRGRDAMIKAWAPHVGQKLILLDRIEDLPEVIVSAIQVNEGATVDAVASTWTGTTAVSVKSSLSQMAVTSPSTSSGGMTSV